MSVLNPYVLLVIAALLIGAGFTGYRQGVKATKADYEQSANEAMTAMIDRHNELAKDDIAAVVRAEKRRQVQRIAGMERQHELEREATRNHRPECDWSERERGLLNDIIDRANGKEATAPGVPDGVRPADAAAGDDGQRSESVGWWGRIKLWGMQKPAQ